MADPLKFLAEAQKLTPSGKVRLIHINAQDIEPGDGAIGAGHHYFHYHEVMHTAAEIDAAHGADLRPKSLHFGGQEYEFWPAHVTGIDLSTEQSASPALAVGDIGGLITRLCLNHSDLLGATVEIIDTYAVFLDGQPGADGAQKQVQTYYIDSKAQENPGEVVSWTLSSPADLEGMQIPRRQIMTICAWQMDGLYGSGEGCTWNKLRPGNKYYDADGNEVQDITKDVCGGLCSDCQKRFGQLVKDPKAAVLDFGGFMGANLIQR